MFENSRDNNFLNKAKDVASFIKDKTGELISDEKLADLVMMSASKQENVNKLLLERGSNYRVSDIDIEVGIPPSVVFGIRRVHEEKPSVGVEVEKCDKDRD